MIEFINNTKRLHDPENKAIDYQLALLKDKLLADKTLQGKYYDATFTITGDYTTGINNFEYSIKHNEEKNVSRVSLEAIKEIVDSCIKKEKFNLKYANLGVNGRESLKFQQTSIDKLELIRSGISKLIWWLVVVPYIISALYILIILANL